MDVVQCSNSGMLQPEQQGGAVELAKLLARFASHLIVGFLLTK